MEPSRIPIETICYVPMGDSYTVGTGVAPEDAFPNLLVDMLHAEGFRIQLGPDPVAEPAALSQDVLEKQVPLMRTMHPQFATLLIGANDVNQGVSTDTFRVNFEQTLDDMLSALPISKPLLIANIPNFLMTPVGRKASMARKLQKEIVEYNYILQEEASTRNVPVIDFFTLSLDFTPADIGPDGLHPSPRGHKTFATAMFRPAVELLALPDID